MEKFKKKSIKILESLINGYLHDFLSRNLPDDKCEEVQNQVIGAIKYAAYIGIIDKEKFEYYIDRVYLEEDKPL